MEEGQFNYEYVGNETNSTCEPVYDTYLDEIKHLFKKPLGGESEVKVNNRNDVAFIESDNIEDSVKFSNTPFNFEDVTDVKGEIIKGNSSNICSDYSNEEGVSASNSSLKKEDGRNLKTIDFPSTFDFTNSMNSKAIPNKIQSDYYFDLNFSNNDNKNKEKENTQILSKLGKNNSEINKLNSNIEEFNFALHNNFNPKIAKFEINSNYIQDLHKDSPNNSGGSEDIVIIDSNPKIANEIINNNRNEIVNDFLVVNSFNSDSQNFNNLDNKYNLENFEVLENEDVDEIEDSEDNRASRRILKDNQERFKKIRDLQEQEIILKAEISQKALDFINNFKNKRTKRTEENKIKNRNQEQSYLTNKKKKNSNPWKRILDLIEIKDTDYPGSKDKSRMRELIISRKRDYDSKRESNQKK